MLLLVIIKNTSGHYVSKHGDEGKAKGCTRCYATIAHKTNKVYALKRAYRFDRQEKPIQGIKQIIRM